MDDSKFLATMSHENPTNKLTARKLFGYTPLILDNCLIKYHCL